MRNNFNKGFTLVEILAVVAILATIVTATVVVMNPIEMLQQAEDAVRLNDINSIHQVLTLFRSQRPGGSIGEPNIVYVSIPSASSTCVGAGLPALPIGWEYRCVPATDLRRIDGNGWIPVNFAAIPGRIPFTILPIDPVNTAASGSYYAFVTDRRTWALATMTRSRRHSAASIGDGGTDFARFEAGTNLSLWTSASGLVGYWSFDGTGSIAHNQTAGLRDTSGRDNHGTASNTNATGMAFVPGRVGNAVTFDGVDDFVDIGNNSVLQTPAGITFTYEAWIRGLPGQVPNQMFINRWLPYFRVDGGRLHLSILAAGAQRHVWGITNLLSDRWHHVVATFDEAGFMRVYLDGRLDGTAGPFLPISNSGTAMRFGIHLWSLPVEPPGEGLYFRGILDESRIYNRALSATEVMANFNATR